MTTSYTLTNYHTHTLFCDGKDSAENFVKAAIEKGFKGIGFSSHAPLEFAADWTMAQKNLDEYVSHISDLKEKYSDKIEILTGLEYDYIDSSVLENHVHAFDSRLDYFILSVHFLGKYDDGTPWSVDGTEDEIKKGIAQTFAGDAKLAATKYFEFLGDGVLKYKPTIVGHADLIKLHNKNNIFFDENESWYQDAAFLLLDKIKEAGSILEINTGGILRNLVDDFYPSAFLIEEAIKKDIPIMVNSDAHSPKDIDGCYEQAFSLLKKLGLKQYHILSKDGKSKILPLS